MKKVQLSVQEVAELLKTNPNLCLLDVRDEQEQAQANISSSQLLTEELGAEILNHWDKTTPMIFYCHYGLRSLQAAYFFLEQGFTQVKSMDGGINAWSLEIDQNIPVYE